MPQDDSKISCETLGDTTAGDDADLSAADYPPESFWLSKDAEYDWFDRNAFYERKESTRGYPVNSNPNPNLHPSPSSNSQKLSANLMSKTSILRLPNAKNAGFVDSKRRTCKPANIRLFPKRFGSSGGKSSVSAAEPGSPKVSCMGRVRSKRCRRKLGSSKIREKPADKVKTRFYSKIMNLFRFRKRSRRPEGPGSRKVMEAVEEDPAAVVQPRRSRVSVKVKVKESFVGDDIPAEPPGLGGMKRLSSGRRSESWTACGGS